MAENRLGPLAPISNGANSTVERAVVEGIFRCPAVPGSPQWRSFCETEVRLALDAASTLRVRP
jgi:hypothetical protein